MPYLKCPLCGNISKIKTGGLEWYKKNYLKNSLNDSGGDIVPGKCGHCYPELKQGDEVIFRKLLSNVCDVKENDTGKIISIHSTNEGKIYKIMTSHKKVEYFVRGELRKKAASKPAC